MSTPAARVLDTAREGRPMAWVMAIMLFLCMLAAAGGIATTRAAAALGDALASRITVQVTAADPRVRQAEAARALATLRALPAVAEAAPVPPAELARLLGPWVADAAAADLPVPALIDVALEDAGKGAAADTGVPALARALRAVAPSARVDANGAALASVSALLAAAAAVAFAVVALVAAATLAVVVLAARAGLAQHGETIAIMHALGATDVQVARLFQRRLTRDALLGVLLGIAAAVPLLLLLGRVASGAGSALLAGATLGQDGWLALAALPVGFVVLAALVARLAVLRALARAL